MRPTTRRAQGRAEQLPAGPRYIDFEHLYRDTRDAVYAYAMGLLRDRAAAEEVTADVFERAFRARGQFERARGKARSWLFGIARNATLDELRRRKRTAAATADGEFEQLTTGEDEATVSDQRLAVRALVAGLPARDRELVALKFYAALTNREIAAVLGTSESNVGTRLNRAISALRKEL